MCLASLLDLPVTQLEPAITAQWRAVRSLSLVPGEAIPSLVAEAGIGDSNIGDAT